MFMQIAKLRPDRCLTLYGMSIMNAEKSLNTLKICLFSQTTKQTLSNFKP